MALYAAIGAEFKSSILKEFDSLLDDRIRAVITRTLKQVAHDYELSYKELKARYCSKESFETYEVQVVTVDLDAPEAEAPAKKAPVKRSEPAKMALSKMKKPDLVLECEERGLDSEGTVSQLKERVKEARDQEDPESKPKPKEPKAKPKPTEPKVKKVKAKKVVPPPPPPPVALEEDEEDVCVPIEEDVGDEDDVEEECSDEEKLRRLLMEAEEEEFCDED